MDQDKSITIYDAANVCVRAFEDLLSLLQEKDNDSFRMVDELRGRFNLWAAYVGAFAAPKASLDARLNLYPDVKHMVLELLDMVSRNIGTTMEANNHSQFIHDSQITEERRPTSRGVRGLDAVEAAIERLLIMAVRIRHGARRTHQARHSTEEETAVSLCCLLVQHRYRHARRSLCNQLGASIYTRGISLQYLQKHNEKLAYNRYDHGGHQEKNGENGLGSSPGGPEVSGNTEAADGKPHPRSAPETFPSALSPSAVLRLMDPRGKPSGSLVSKGSTVRDPQGDHCQYPPKPRQQNMQKYIPCTLCSDPLEASTMTKAAWSAHVDRDLEPYVCISEECREPLRYFVSKQDWMDHMQSRHTITWAQKVHTEMWYCDVSHSVPVEFDDVTKLLTHLQSEHGNQLTKSKLQGHEVKAVVEEKPHKLLSDHIARHLKSLAFLSLSYVEDVFEDPHSSEISEDVYSFSTSLETTGDKRDGEYSHGPVPRRAIPFLGDIPETQIAPDGTRRVGEQVLSGAPSPLPDPEDWAFVPVRSFPTNLDILCRGLNGMPGEPMSRDSFNHNLDPASAFRSQAPWNEAIKIILQEMELQNKVLGAEHPDTLMTMAYLAYAYWNQGLFKDAESLQLQELQLCSKVLGSRHTSTLTSINNLACILWSEGRWQEAEAQFQRVTNLREEVLGPEHSSTLTSMSNLASTYRSLGRWTEADDLDQRVVGLWKRILGPANASTLTSMSNVAFALWNKGEFKKAEEMEKAIVGTQTGLLGSKHPDTLISLNNLACTYQSQKRWAEAETLAMEVIGTSRELLGSEHPFTLTSLGNLASTYRNQGRLEEAERLEMRVLAAQETALGSEHPDTLLTKWNLAHTLKQQERYTEALAMLDRCVESQTRQLGPHHPHTVAATAHLKKWHASFKSIAIHTLDTTRKRKHRKA
ncbi:hypothetical protein CDV55_103853 [Aspergillus turcosus]|uniref:C2H2-type domain-containing protein n=1 Tax=Aspergillus turcosus TaxID=1245748 RepID=A0A397IF42_9EURO|nr:hypothetical protein CDV55_103853 [Aspergillus turcosus]RLL98198.1 hypothetical protein CFD26_104189 [Aspergillus turcosus]